MSISRRNVLKSIAWGIPALQIAPPAMGLNETNSERISSMEKGRFNQSGLRCVRIKIPEWFHRAKIKESIV